MNHFNSDLVKMVASRFDLSNRTYTEHASIVVSSRDEDLINNFYADYAGMGMTIEMLDLNQVTVDPINVGPDNRPNS